MPVVVVVMRMRMFAVFVPMVMVVTVFMVMVVTVFVPMVVIVVVIAVLAMVVIAGLAMFVVVIVVLAMIVDVGELLAADFRPKGDAAHYGDGKERQSAQQGPEAKILDEDVVLIQRVGPPQQEGNAAQQAACGNGTELVEVIAFVVVVSVIVCHS
jgi:hypothetical protein